jgi:hypothetical protein
MPYNLWMSCVSSHLRLPLDKLETLWTLLNKGKRVEKTDLCEWASQALEESLTTKNIKSGFRKTGIWPFNEHAVLGSMQPSRGFEERQEDYVPSVIDESEGDEFGGGEECMRGEKSRGGRNSVGGLVLGDQGDHE